jgi:hypothetical protein
MQSLVYLEHRLDGFLGIPRPSASEHFQNHTSEAVGHISDSGAFVLTMKADSRPDVDFGAVSLLLVMDNLRCHPEDGALHRHVGIVVVDIVTLLANAKV